MPTQLLTIKSKRQKLVNTTKKSFAVIYCWICLRRNLPSRMQFLEQSPCHCRYAKRRHLEMWLFIQQCLVRPSQMDILKVLSVSPAAVCCDTENRDFCMHEAFSARCQNGSLVMMLSALYGRMRLGRCINGDFNVGCSTDVVSYFDSLCTGRRSCDVSVRNLVDIHPCQRDFTSYLDASYRCIRGENYKHLLSDGSRCNNRSCHGHNDRCYEQMTQRNYMNVQE